MNNMIERARTGRTIALAQRQPSLGADMQSEVPAVRFKTSRRVDAIAFISTRTQVQAGAWIH